jgi:ATP-dependent Lhr-like helicase
MPAASSRARAVAEFLQAHGASFHDEIVDGTRLLRTQVEDALAELVAQGRVTSDSFAGLRALVTRRKSASGSPGSAATAAAPSGRGRCRPLGAHAAPAAGCARNPDAPAATASAGPGPVEHVAHALLRRYGVVAWKILQREATWLPPGAS